MAGSNHPYPCIYRYQPTKPTGKVVECDRCCVVTGPDWTCPASGLGVGAVMRRVPRSDASQRIYPPTLASVFSIHNNSFGCKFRLWQELMYAFMTIQFCTANYYGKLVCRVCFLKPGLSAASALSTTCVAIDATADTVFALPAFL